MSSQLDKEHAARAYKKVMSGEQPTSAEQAALRRYEKAQEEQRRWSYYDSIPQKHWRQMSGRQTKVLQEQAERYGLPFGGRTISLPQVVRRLHDFLAANARKLAPDEDDLLVGDVSRPALERYREERALLARLDRLVTCRHGPGVAPAEQVHFRYAPATLCGGPVDNRNPNLKSGITRGGRSGAAVRRDRHGL